MGKLEIQQIKIYQKQQNWNPMKLHCQKNRCPREQDFRKATVCPSGTLPPDIPQIWNGHLCTLISEERDCGNPVSAPVRFNLRKLNQAHIDHNCKEAFHLTVTGFHLANRDRGVRRF